MHKTTLPTVRVVLMQLVAVFLLFAAFATPAHAATVPTHTAKLTCASFSNYLTLTHTGYAGATIRVTSTVGPITRVLVDQRFATSYTHVFKLTTAAYVMTIVNADGDDSSHAKGTYNLRFRVPACTAAPTLVASHQAPHSPIHGTVTHPGTRPPSGHGVGSVPPTGCTPEHPLNGCVPSGIHPLTTRSYR